MKNSLYNQYYDAIFSSKNYNEEAKIVLNFFKKYKKKYPRKILDVGCGTGSHDIAFAKKSCKVFGVDIDTQAIRIAQKKAEQILEKENLQFLAGDIFDVPSREKNFDLAVSLFNVVNYINKTDEMIAFLKSISQKLKKGDIFIFDAWNGLAALLDPPREKKKNIIVDGAHIKIHTIPKIDVFRQSVLITNLVVVEKNKKREKFSFGYNSFLWTPEQLSGLLDFSGFKVLKISSWENPQKSATEKSWKIIYICQKI